MAAMAARAVAVTLLVLPVAAPVDWAAVPVEPVAQVVLLQQEPAAAVVAMAVPCGSSQIRQLL